MGLPHAVQGGRALDDPVTGRLWDRDAYRRRVGEGEARRGACHVRCRTWRKAGVGGGPYAKHLRRTLDADLEEVGNNRTKL